MLIPPQHPGEREREKGEEERQKRDPFQHFPSQTRFPGINLIIISSPLFSCDKTHVILSPTPRCDILF